MEKLYTQRNTGYYLTLFALVYLLICALFTISLLDPEPDNRNQLLNWAVILLLALKISEVALVTIPLPKPNPRKGYIIYSIIVLALIVATFLSAKSEDMQNAVVLLTAAALFFQSISIMVSSIMKYYKSYKDEISDGPSKSNPVHDKDELLQMASSSIPLPKPNPK